MFGHVDGIAVGGSIADAAFLVVIALSFIYTRGSGVPHKVTTQEPLELCCNPTIDAVAAAAVVTPPAATV